VIEPADDLLEGLQYRLCSHQTQLSIRVPDGAGTGSRGHDNPVAQW
jgi:hypothetical protein